MKGDLSISSIRIDKFRNKITDGEIKIPPFQRDFVWKEGQIIDLLDSILNDYPIGSVLLWETNEDLPAKRDIGNFVLPESKADYPINYVLDGQQRLTSLFSVFSFGLKQVDSDQTTRPEILYNVSKKVFVSNKDVDGSSKYLPLKLLFDNFNFNRYIRDNGFTQEETSETDRLQSIFQNYEIPTVTIKKRSKNDVGVIFERINNTGTPLVTLDLMVAWTWMDGFHLKEKFQSIYDSLEAKHFRNIKDKILLQSLSAILQKTTKTREILKLDPELVRENIELLKTSLEKAIDYLTTQFNAKSEDFLPKAQQIVGLTYLFSKSHSLNADQTNIVKQWFWRTSFSDRYSSSTDSKMDEDLVFFDEILSGKYVGIDRYYSEINEAILIRQPFLKSNSYVRGILLLLSKLNPLDLTNGNRIDTGEALSGYNKKEYHHIFPNAFLKNLLQKQSNINSICNFCFLPANSNKIISNKAPSNYFKTIVPSAQLETILDSNLIPRRIAIYETDNYEEFLDERARLILQEIKVATNE